MRELNHPRPYQKVRLNRRDFSCMLYIQLTQTTILCIIKWYISETTQIVI